MKIVPYNILTLCCALISLTAYVRPLELRAEDTAATEAAQIAPANIADPMNDMHVTLDKILVVVEKLPGEEHVTERRKQLREIIQPRFDFDEMSRRCLGPSWQERTEPERKEFVDVFSDLLANTYLSKIETVKSGMVKLQKENIEFPRAIVRTQVTSKGETFPIDYKLFHNASGWQVYDVVIENIGLVANYRNEFAGIMRKEEFSGLMNRLREKAKKKA